MATDLERRAMQGAGDADLMFQLAGLHAKGGDGVARSASKALHWMRLAAERGHAVAQCVYGGQLAAGDGESGARDPSAAAEWCVLVYFLSCSSIF